MTNHFQHATEIVGYTSEGSFYCVDCMPPLETVTDPDIFTPVFASDAWNDPMTCDLCFTQVS